MVDKGRMGFSILLRSRLKQELFYGSGYHTRNLTDSFIFCIKFISYYYEKDKHYENISFAPPTARIICSNRCRCKQRR